MPEHTLHLEPAQLQALVGADTAAALMRLPAQYRAQAAAAAAPPAQLGGGDGVAAAAAAAETGDAPAGAGDAPAAAPPPRLVECFVRRFSAATRPWIKMHADVAGVTVNVALTDEGGATDCGGGESCEGGEACGGSCGEGNDGSAAGRAGGGVLLGVYDGAVRALARRAGDATVHPSSLLHGVSRMHEGERYTLILFFQ